MGEDGGSTGSGEGADSATLNRRRLLQGAAAAGVGAAAWSAPNITTLGFTPAYAQVCTQPLLEFEVSNRNTACNCGSNPNKRVSYKEFGTACAGTAYPGTAVLRSGTCAGPLIGNSGECPQGFGGNAGVCVSAPPAGTTCKIRVIVQQGNCTGTPIAVVISDAFSGPGFVDMPAAPCQGSGNVFVRVQIVCSVDPDCLPATT